MKLIEFLKGKKTYAIAIMSLLYIAGSLLDYWKLSAPVLAGFGGVGLITMRLGLKDELKKILDMLPVVFLVAALGLALMVSGCGTGATVGVSGGTEGSITGQVTYPIDTNAVLTGTVTGNPETGEVSGGITITFPKTPSELAVLALNQAGAQDVDFKARVGTSGKVWLLPWWNYKDQKQGTALELALREGATLTRSGGRSANCAN